jgi:L-fuconolactonase
MKIDSHQHFWIVGKFDYPWMSPKLGVLYRDYLPRDLAPLLHENGIDKSIVVQASPTVAETDWLLELAAEHDFIAGVVGWLDVEAKDFPKQFERYRRNPRFIGIRPAVEFIPDDAWLATPRVIESLKVVEAADFPFDLIVWPRHLTTVLRMLEEVPRLRCVVDHLAKPGVETKQFESWRKQIARVALHPNVHCKLSGLPSARPSDAQPLIDHVIGCFGPERVMFGSDWPISLRVGDYAQSVQLIRQTAMRVPEHDLFGKTAARFYKLNVTLR